MKDNCYYYFGLSAYLSRADTHYIEGRFLWFHYAMEGASNLLWLAIEQLIKLNIIQSRLETCKLEDIVDRETKTLLKYDSQELDIRKIHKILDQTSYKINSKHDLGELLKILKDETWLDLTQFLKTLEKIKEYYERRYYKDVGTSISLNQLDIVDEIYFCLRGNLNECVPRALIDEIGYRNKFGEEEPLPYFTFAHKNNKHFKQRRHPVVHQYLSNGKAIDNDGIFDNFCNMFCNS